jgi:hypothetical protein
MLRYDWSRPVKRLFWGAVMSAGFVIVRHTGGRFAITPPHCDGDLFQGLIVFGEFFLGCSAIEGAIWTLWYRDRWREMREARASRNNSEDYILSGGRLLGVENITGKFLLAFGFLAIGMYAGPNPCTNQSLSGLTWLQVLASLAASYGMLLCGDIVMK